MSRLVGKGSPPTNYTVHVIVTEENTVLTRHDRLYRTTNSRIRDLSVTDLNLEPTRLMIDAL